MKRRALLIGPNFQDLPGVKVDMNAWHSFLTSPLGGAWSETEICDASELISGQALTRQALRPLVQEAWCADYIFIAFSGHGGTYRREMDAYNLPETYIFLNDEDCISERELIPKAYGKRCTILLDCCRTPDNNIPNIKTASRIDESAQLLAKALARKCFDDELAKCEFGLTRIYSTAPGYAAADVSSFTQCMIAMAKSFLENSDRQIITLKEATALASVMLKLIHGTQIPVYTAGRRHYHFPFAVKPLLIDSKNDEGNLNP